MKKIGVSLVMIALLVVAGLFAKVLYNGPRMRTQEHLRTYQMVQPLPVEGVVPVTLPEQLPTGEATSSVRNPVPDSTENRNRGQVYYQYYCVFCHGDEGAGNGPVGESYTPVPADLRTGRIAAYNDGELLRAMLMGIGHEPVLERVVPARHRWYLVTYLRSLKR